ncbi:hypothetical protein IQ227_03655 [Anabaena aphanizomenioides LEGE 00250]|uniref:Uncharacterized protein n=1 Tax=Sphaerospermopsis aphanizomenoides LEGE 00250 TaxID=2777972 RepID=A0ABR9VBS2_9CYAN|nr:hypothetical protein [Sphaerospermopsis aphanizomenoides]MBE9235157.1 hypothetical protein [Sphaerospermopsis aphanizomenoides LEGE 00250]
MISTTIQNQIFKETILDKSHDNLQVFQDLFNKILTKHYEELYEAEADASTCLEDDVKAVIEIIGNGNESLNHLRYKWMTLIIILAVEPTLEYYDPNNRLPKIIIQVIEKSLYQNIKGSSNTINPDMLDKFINEIFRSHESYFHKKEANFQAISEALNVFYNAIRVLDYHQSVEAILEILDDCLEGDAIFPGYQGRRELFDWWLLDVVPASYNLLPPTVFYVVEGVKNKEEIRSRQSRLLEKISKRIRSYLPELILESPKHKNYIFPSPGKINREAFKNSVKIRYQSKNPQLAYSL